MEHLKTHRLLSALMALVMVFSLLPVSAFAETSAAQAAPTAITAELADTPRLVDGTLIVDQGDVYHLKALDQDGRETPVTWSCPGYMTDVKLDAETGTFEVIGNVTAGGSSYYYFTATSTLNPEISHELRLEATGFRFSDWAKTKNEQLPEDGQRDLTVTVSGGLDGHNQWTFDQEAMASFAVLTKEPGKGGSVSFRCFRPGDLDVTFALDFDETLTDTASIHVGGVAVEDSTGESKKTYLSFDEGKGTSAQLTAFCEEGHQVASWHSANEQVVTVDETGRITAAGVGSAIVQAVDDQGKKGGIKVVVTSENTPYFENFEFRTNDLKWGSWSTGVTFQPTVLDYQVQASSASTNQIGITAETKFNDDKFQAQAVYTDKFGQQQTVEIQSGEAAVIKDIRLGVTDVVITVSEKANPANATVYTFQVTRPRDTADGLRWDGIRLQPEGRPLSKQQYKGGAEGTMFQADDQGVAGENTGVSPSQPNYRTYLLENGKTFRLGFDAGSAFVHIRISTDDGKTWMELPEGSHTTDPIAIGESGVAQVRIQTISDAAYYANREAGKDGFDGAVKCFCVWVESVDVSAEDMQLLTLEADHGDLYPGFRPSHTNYNVVSDASQETIALTFTATKGTVVKMGQDALTADSQGRYTVQMKDSATLTVTDDEGSAAVVYQFKRVNRSAQYDVPDKVTDYLCINSQYTNSIGFGMEPERTLAGSLKSLGNFGGYVTYYYDDPIRNDPANPYGVDFFVYGNANVENGGTGYGFFEPGQVWVSEDGQDWYALAGSEHYEKDTLWDYQVTYTNDGGRTAWRDNYGNTSADAAGTGSFARPENYPLHQFAGDSIQLSGILLPAGDDGTILGNANSQACHVSWGYADAFANGPLGQAVNPYQENSDMSKQKPMNGFDLDWAVDAQGNPVEVDDVHYVKVVTASNLWHSAFKEKSTEVSQVMRAAAGEAPVGRTEALESITVSDGSKTETVTLQEGQQICELALEDRSTVSILPNGAAEDANIYINNTRVAPGQALEGIGVEDETLVRVIVQTGEQEPRIYLLKLIPQTHQELLEGVCVTVDGADQSAATTDGQTYTMTVSHRTASVGIAPVAADGVQITINSQAPQKSYDLDYGENTFEITAASGAAAQTVQLIITRQAAPRVGQPIARLTGNADTGKPVLTWNQVEGADHYEVWRKTGKDGTFALFFETRGTRMNNTSARPGETYYYKVRAVSDQGTAGDFSLTKHRTCDCARPRAKAVTRTSDGKPVLTWNKVEGARKYVVYSSLDGGLFQKLFETRGTRMVNTSAHPGHTYAYQVKAICANEEGNSAFSVSVETTAAQATLAEPTIKLTGNANSGKPVLSWNKVKGADHYEVWRKIGKDGKFTLLLKTDGTRMTNTSAQPGQTCYYKVRAVAKDGGRSDFSLTKYRTCDCARPDVQLTTRSGKPYLQWNKVKGAVEYEVYRSVNGQGYELLRTTRGTHLTNGSARSGETCKYRVRAVCANEYGSSALSYTDTIKVK